MHNRKHMKFKKEEKQFFPYSGRYGIVFIERWKWQAIPVIVVNYEHSYTPPKFSIRSCLDIIFCSSDYLRSHKRKCVRIDLNLFRMGAAEPLKTHYPLKRPSFLSVRRAVVDINFEVTPDRLAPPFSGNLFFFFSMQTISEST